MNKGLKTWIEKNKSPLTFVLKLLLSYLALQFIYDYIISPYTPLDFWLINSIIDSSEKLLEVMGYTLIESNLLYQYHMGIEGTSGVVIGNPCDGLSLFILFTAFLIVFKGKWWFKLIFTLGGILLIHFLNVIRVASLALIVKYAPGSLDFHHSYTFTLFVYACIFLLWVLRVKIYQKKKI
tara:strand:- start:306 stop:845 length:540 start_codon:yes stop_codon:yes gene_type:complete